MNSIKVDSVSFSSRYLNIKNPEAFPQRVYDAIYKSEGIDEFLHKGKPQTLWEKITDIFKRDEVLTVTYKPDSLRILKKITGDPYAKAEEVEFVFGRKDSLMSDLRKGKVRAEQHGVKRKQGSVPKQGEHHMYKKPEETVDMKLAKEIENIKDLDSLLIR